MGRAQTTKRISTQCQMTPTKTKSKNKHESAMDGLKGHNDEASSFYLQVAPRGLDSAEKKLLTSKRPLPTESGARRMIDGNQGS